jgi:hypothetical protein
MTEPSKHSGGRRKAAKHAEPVRRRSGPSRLAWARTTRGQVGIAVVVLGLAVVLRLVASGHQPTGAQRPVGPPLTTYGTDWKAHDGSSYRLTVTPLAELVGSGSPDGCVPAAAPGRTNLRFTVRVDNLGSAPAPVPDLAFAVNTRPSGAIAKKLSFDDGSKDVDLTPTTARDCAHAARVTGAGQPRIAPQSATTFTGLLGGVRTPVGPGLTLVVRYDQSDAGSPTGTGTADVAVLYPDLRRLSASATASPSAR